MQIIIISIQAEQSLISHLSIIDGLAL